MYQLLSEKIEDIKDSIVIDHIEEKAHCLNVSFERKIKTYVSEPLEINMANRTKEEVTILKPGEIFDKEEILLTITNKGPEPYKIYYKYDIKVKGKGAKYVYYDLFVETDYEKMDTDGKIVIVPKIIRSKEFILAPDETARIKLVYGKGIAEHVNSGFYDAKLEIKLKIYRKGTYPVLPSFKDLLKRIVTKVFKL
ncbi:MAG: hypothetical protein QXQ19_00455 [Candidatus Aenigmatarchaeota archaeon]